MDVHWIAFRVDTGEIVNSGTAPEEMVAIQAMPGEIAMAAADGIGPATHYAPGSVLTQRPSPLVQFDKTTIVADGQDHVLFHSVPIGATVLVDEVPAGVVDDGVYEFASEVPGTFKVRLSAWPHLDAVLEITAI
jgi:hypothetical protein